MNTLDDCGNTFQSIPSLPGIISLLGELKPGAIVTEQGLALMFDRHITSVKRAVMREELPPPTSLFGSKCWTAGAIVGYIEGRLEHEAKERDDLATKVRKLSP